MCSCLRALKTSLAAEFWTFWGLSRRCFGEVKRGKRNKREAIWRNERGI